MALPDTSRSAPDAGPLICRLVAMNTGDKTLRLLIDDCLAMICQQADALSICQREAEQRAQALTWQPIEQCTMKSPAGDSRVKRLLVFGPDFGVQFGRVMGYSDGTWRAYAEGFHGSDWLITHWMPLPAAPALSSPDAAKTEQTAPEQDDTRVDGQPDSTVALPQGTDRADSSADMRIEIRHRSAGYELRTFGGILEHGAVWGPTLSDALATLSRLVAASDKE